MENQTLVNEICPTTTQGWIKRGALLVDVREKEEVEQVRYDVPKYMNIPLSEFEDRFAEIPKGVEVVVACKGGGRSLRATGFLINHGYSKDQVVNMQYGITRWIQKGFPVKGDPSEFLSNPTGDSCCSTPVEKPKKQLSDLGNSCDCSKPGCC